MKKHTYNVDYHIHSNISQDGHESIDSICKCAIKQGLKEIAITDHFDPWAENPSGDGFDLARLETEIASAQKKFEGKLKILKGVEVGQAGNHPVPVKTLLDSTDFDYVIGSVHYIDDELDVAMFQFDKHNYKTIFEKYFLSLYEMAKTGLYDCIGHLDYPKRYASVYGIRMSHGYYMEIIEAIFKEVIKNGKGIEINCSGLRQKIADTLPTYDIVKLYKKMGGINITVGSDAHRLYAVGGHTEKALQMLEDVGFNYITLYEKRTPRYLKI